MRSKANTEKSGPTKLQLPAPMLEQSATAIPSTQPTTPGLPGTGSAYGETDPLPSRGQRFAKRQKSGSVFQLLH